jgi:hypothetical protein
MTEPTDPSTPAQNTVDGSTNAAPTCQRCRGEHNHDTVECCSTHRKQLCHACYRRTHFVERCNCQRPECTKAEEHATDVRPVMPVVARVTADEVIADYVRGESPRDPFVDMGVLLDEVYRLRAANRELTEDYVPMVSSDFLTFVDGVPQITMTGARKVIAQLAESMALMLDDAKAENYVEIDAVSPPAGRSSRYGSSAAATRRRTSCAARPTPGSLSSRWSSPRTGRRSVSSAPPSAR